MKRVIPLAAALMTWFSPPLNAQLQEVRQTIFGMD